jgi:amino acid transporter
MEAEQIQADAAQLASFGYKQQLTRALGLWSNFSLGFTYLSPVVGVYTLFAFGLATAGPAVIWTIPIVVAGQFLVVLTFGEVASRYPIAGGIYQWCKHLLGERYAWFAGWFYIWALLVTIAAVAFGSVPYVGALFGFTVTSGNTKLVAILMIALAALINLTGVRNLARIAVFGVIAEILGTIVFGIIFLAKEHHHGLGAIFHTAGAGSGAYTGAFLGAALFSVWIFYGFEACGDVAEEVVNPSRRIPRAMQLTLIVGAVTAFFITLSYILAVPSFGAVIKGDNANPIIGVIDAALGHAGSKVALAMVVIAFVSCTLAIQAAAIRLIFSYARDGMIFGSRPLSTVSPRFHMPPGAVAVAAVIPAAISLLSGQIVARIITFAVVGIYVSFQLVVLAVVLARRRGWQATGAFSLGRWGPIVNLVALFYGVAAIVILSDKTPASVANPGFFDRWLVPISAGIVAAIGLVYLFVFKPKARVRPDARVDGAPSAEPVEAPPVPAH